MNIPDEGFTLLTQGCGTARSKPYSAPFTTPYVTLSCRNLTARCRLPGSRVMAERLHLSRNTVNAALEQLALEVPDTSRQERRWHHSPPAAEAGQMPPVVLPERLQGCQPRCAATHRRWHLRRACRR